MLRLKTMLENKSAYSVRIAKNLIIVAIFYLKHQIFSVCLLCERFFLTNRDFSFKICCMKFRKKEVKRCPRCNNKCLINQDKCDECGLIFSRLAFASNRAAKKKILHFDRDFVIYTNQYPKDVSWLKLLIYSLLFGLVGGHYYYVGKYVKGGLMTAGFVYLVFCTVFNEQMFMLLENNYFYIPIAFLAVAWIYSFTMICIRRFKVPVIVDLGLEENKNVELK